jgi:hypothetical protein
MYCTPIEIDDYLLPTAAIKKGKIDATEFGVLFFRACKK